MQRIPEGNDETLNKGYLTGHYLVGFNLVIWALSTGSFNGGADPVMKLSQKILHVDHEILCLKFLCQTLSSGELNL